MVQINGAEKSGYENISVEDMVMKEGFDKSRIAVEINGEIVSKSDYKQELLHDGDVIEVVSFVGGG